MIEVRESFRDYMERSNQDKNEEIKILRKSPLIDRTLEEMDSSIILETGTACLLERLEINSILAAMDEEIDSNKFYPVTRELIYNYDFGDNWIVTITRHKDCDDLLKQNIIDYYEFEEAYCTPNAR